MIKSRSMRLLLTKTPTFRKNKFSEAFPGFRFETDPFGMGALNGDMKEIGAVFSETESKNVRTRPRI